MNSPLPLVAIVEHIVGGMFFVTPAQFISAKACEEAADMAARRPALTDPKKERTCQ